MLYLKDTKIAKVYFGNTELLKGYFASQLVHNITNTGTAGGFGGIVSNTGSSIVGSSGSELVNGDTILMNNGVPITNNGVEIINSGLTISGTIVGGSDNGLFSGTDNNLIGGV